jgi:hypothetical protein
VAAEDSAAGQPLSETLSRWLDWTQAITLAAALDQRPDPGARAAHPPDVQAWSQRVERLRATLTAAIQQDFGDADDGEPAERRQRHVARQKAMEAAIAAARADLRQALSAAASPRLARLASLDEAMERMLAERGRVLLSAVPRWSEQQRLHRPARQLLLAELDFRLQPLEGLLDALRPRDHGLP